ncbi:MAG: O-antigen ligase family protein [candidate division FCPU426 bacterium]
MTAFLLGHWYPRWVSRNGFWAVAGLVGALLLIPQTFLPQTVSLFLLGSLLLAAFLWLLLAFHTETQGPVAFGPAVLAYAAAWALSVLWSQDPAASINPFARELALLLLFLGATLTARTVHTARPALLALFGVAAVLALYGLYQHVTGLAQTYQQVFGVNPPEGPLNEEIARRLSSRRAFSLLVYPNLLAGFLSQFLPLGFALLLTARRRWAAVLVAGGLVLVMLGLYATGSVGGWMSAVVGLALFFFWWQHGSEDRLPWVRTWMVWAAGSTLALGVALVLILARDPQMLSANLVSRGFNWLSTLRMGWEHAATGVGPGVFGSLFPEYQHLSGSFVRYAHNFLLQRFAETGLLGVGAFVWLAAAVGLHAKKGFSKIKNHPQRILALGLAAGLAAGLLHALVDVDLDFLKTSLTFWLFAGTLAGLTGSKKSKPEPAAAPWEPWLRWTLFMVGTVVLWRAGRSLVVMGTVYWLAAAALLWFFLARLTQWQNWEQGLRRLPWRWPLGMLFVWSTLSALASPHPAGAITGLSLGLLALVVFALASTAANLGAWLAPLAGAGALALALMALGESLTAPAGARATAGWPNPNILAAYLSLGGLSLSALAIWAPWRRNWRLAAGAGGVLVFLALLATGSMAGLLNFAVGTGLLLARLRQGHSRYFSAALGAAALLAILAVLLPMSAGNRLRDWQGYSGQAYERSQLALASLKMIRDHPILGVGPGNFADAFERYSFPNLRGLARYGKQAEFAHNEALQMAAATGLPGLLLLGTGLLMLYWHFRRYWRAGPLEAAKPPSWEAAARIAAWAGLAGAMAQALLDFNWHVPGLLLWYMLLAGVATAPPSAAPFAKSKPVSWPELWRVYGRQPLTVLLAVLLAAVALTATRPLVGEYLERLGEALHYKQDLKAASRAYERALLVHPLSSRGYDRLGLVRTDLYALMDADNWYQLADWAFRRALSLNGSDAFIHRHLGVLLGLRASRLAGEERERLYDQAENAFRQAVERAPHQAPLYFELGNQLRDAGRMDGAERAWRIAVDLEPRYAGAWSNLGLAEEMRRAYPEAERSLRIALELQALAPSAQGKYEWELLSLNWAVVHYNLAQLLERQARWSEAEWHYREALALEPDNTLFHQRWETIRKKLP